MNSEQSSVQPADLSDETTETRYVPRWAIVAGVLVVSLPVLLMSSMMLVMGWIGPPMGGGMAGPDLRVFRLVGFVPLLVVLGVTFGVYRLYPADTE